MALTFGSAVGANGGATNTTTLVATIPTVTAGHFCLICVCFAAAGTFSAIGGWTLEAQAQNSGGAVSSAAIYSRVLQAGDTAPTVTHSVGGKRSHVSSTWVPGGGETPSIYAQATTVITPAGTAHTPNAVSSTDANSVSFVFNGSRAQSAGATAITQTPASTPAAYTEPANGDQSTAIGTTNALRQVGAHIEYRTAVGTGSIAPGAATITGGVSGGSTIDIAFHVLLRSVAGAAGGLPPRSRRAVEPPYAQEGASYPR